jgi:hypothetical protein
MLPQSECESSGGVWQGEGVTCLDATCDATEQCPGDVDNDGVTGIDDLLEVLSEFESLYDVDDLLEVIGSFGCTV